jgi:hypothetical protein
MILEKEARKKPRTPCHQVANRNIIKVTVQSCSKVKTNSGSVFVLKSVSVNVNAIEMV